MFILPSSSHLSPKIPNGQVHSNLESLTFLQEPPLKHGALAHGLPVSKQKYVEMRTSYNIEFVFFSSTVELLPRWSLLHTLHGNIILNWVFQSSLW